MASSLITALTVTTPHAGMTPAPVTDGEHNGLLNALTKIPDPRDPRGIRHPLSAVLTIAVCAVMAGASSFAAITDWLHDLDEHARNQLGFGDGVPAGTTMWRLLIRLDPTLLASVLAGWLHARTQHPALPLPRRYRRVVAIDGKTLRGARLPDGRQISPAVRPGYHHRDRDRPSHRGHEVERNHLVRAAARRRRSRPRHSGRSTVHRRRLTHPDRPRRRDHRPSSTPARSGQRQPADPAQTAQTASLGTQIPVGDRTRDRHHGRRETRTVKAVTVATPGGIGFPHAQQAARITRTRIVAGRTSRETAYLTVSLPAGHATARDLQTWIRRHWHIENRLHHVRDVTFREDLHQARTGNGPAVIATLRNTAIAWHQTAGATNIARATRQANRRSHDLITAVTSSHPTTQ